MDGHDKKGLRKYFNGIGEGRGKHRSRRMGGKRPEELTFTRVGSTIRPPPTPPQKGTGTEGECQRGNTGVNPFLFGREGGGNRETMRRRDVDPPPGSKTTFREGV